MPQVTKKIYPTISVGSINVPIVMSSSGDVYITSSYEYIQATFDTSKITSIPYSATLKVNVTQATKTMQGGYDASKLRIYLKLDSIGGNHNLISYSTGTISNTISETGLSLLATKDKQSISLYPDIMDYSGSSPDYTKQIATMKLAIDTEENQTTYLEYTIIEPSISNFTVMGTSVDSNIVCSWIAEDVTNITINAKLNGVIKATKICTTEATCMFVPGDLTEAGEYTFEIIASNGSQTVVVTKTATLTVTQVTITSLEPNAVNQLKSSNINISFGGNNITNYSISARQNGVTKWSTSGTNTSGAISFNFQMVKNLFDIGNVELGLTCTYNGQYYSNTVSQTATFLVYGNPSKPTIIAEQTYTTPIPTINFSCADSYISYQVEVDGIQGTETFGTPNKYKIQNALSNNEYHTFKVRVKNQYQLWSEWASVTFLVSYAELETPIINAYADNINDCIMINVESVSQENFHNHSVFRSEDGKTWTEIAKQLALSDSFTDLTCASNVLYYYKARANDVNGGIKDSETMSCVCEFERSVLSVPFSQNSITLEYFGDEKSINKQIANNTERTFTRVCGLRQPKSKRSNVKYNSFSLNLAFKTKDDYKAFMEFEDEEVLLFRDKNGLKLYCDMAITSEQDMRYYFKIVSITLTEIYYKEGDYEEEPDTTFSYVKDEW